MHRCDGSCPHWQELRDDPGNGLKGGEVIVPGSMQCLVATDVALRKHLLAGGAHTAVQARLLGAGLPRTLLVPLGLGAWWLFTAAEVRVRRQQLLLLGRVRQQHQQLTEDLLEVLPKQVSAALVVLGCGYHSLPPREQQLVTSAQAPAEGSLGSSHPRPPHLSEFPRVALKLAEAGLVALHKALDGLDELQVPLPKVLRD